MKALMRYKQFLVVAAWLALLVCPAVAAPTDSEELAKLLPVNVGTFHRVSGPRVADQGTKVAVMAEYAGQNGGRFAVMVHRFPQDGRAYEFFTDAARLDKTAKVDLTATIGTASFSNDGIVCFFKGPYYVEVAEGKTRAYQKEIVALATELAATLDRGEGEIPVLIKHLPNWEQAGQNALFLNRFTSLQSIANDPVLDAINSEGDADAVLAKYDSMRLLIIEFNTPQRALENDQRIVARVQELWKLGQPAPTAYKRVGNYSVFVFDAPSDQAAKQLLDQVHYEQVVSWLGENPNILKEAEKQYVRTTLGVLVAVIKASGFALVACFGTGALFGTLLFRRRRAQQRTAEAFSDAGGMLRLNLDEMTPQTNPARLISRQ